MRFVHNFLEPKERTNLFTCPVSNHQKVWLFLDTRDVTLTGSDRYAGESTQNSLF